jgi:hypothetical protein
VSEKEWEHDLSYHRWSSSLLPEVPAKFWRKSPQWFMLTKQHAEIVVEDVDVAAKFQTFPTSEMFANMTHSDGRPKVTKNPYVPDEHYIPTLLAIHGHGTHQSTDCSGGRHSYPPTSFVLCPLCLW